MSDQPNLDATEQQRALSLELPPTQSEFSSLSTQEAEGGESQGKRTVEPHVVIESPSPNDKSIEGTRLKDSPTQDEFSSFNITQEVVDEESQQERIVEPQNVVENPSPTKRSIGGASFKSLGRMTSTVLNLRDLPDHVADNLRQFDINGDGMISMTELVHGALTRQEQEEKVIFFRRMIIAFVLIWMMTMAAFFGVVYGAIEASRDSSVHQSHDGATLVSKDYAHVVQTANSDFFVASDGSAYVRPVTSQEYEEAEGSYNGNEENFNVMKTSAATSNITFSSYIPDEVLMELKSISIRSPAGAHLSLQVLGVLRMPPEGVSNLGAVTILTHIGRIVIDGTAVSFYDDTEVALFENAGFVVKEGASVSGRRRLLDGIQALFGIFNAVASLKNWDASSPAYANIPPPLLPSSFVMHSRRFAPCIANPNIDGSVTPYEGYLGGTLPSVAGVDYCDLLQISDEHLATTYLENGTVIERFIETIYVIYRVGSDYLRVEYVHPLHPNVTFVEVLDNSDPQNPLQFHYNVDSHTRGLEITTISEDLDIVEFKGPIYYYNTSNLIHQNLVEQALSAPFEYMGTTSFQDTEVRIWAMHLVNNTVHAFWYDSVDTQQVQRIDYGDFGMLDVVGITPLNDTELSAMSYLFTQPIKDVTTVVDGATDELIAKVGINPYDPFIADFSTRSNLQPGGSRRLFEEEEDEDGREAPLEVPPELLIPNAEARRRRHVPGTETAPKRSQPKLVLTLKHTEVDEETVAAAVAERELFALMEDRDHTAEEAAAPVVALAPSATDTTPVPSEYGNVNMDITAAVVHTTYGKEVEAAMYCPAGWVGSENMCYYFYSASYNGNWDICNALCKSTGSNMLCIQSATQNTFVYNRIAERGGATTWIGLRKDANNIFNWGLGCVSSYYNWKAGRPKQRTFSNPYGNGKWAAIGGKIPQWVDQSSKAYSCACQNDFATSAPSAMPTLKPTGATVAPSMRPTAVPTCKPTAKPTFAVTTYRPTSAPNAQPLDKPPLKGVEMNNIATISSYVSKKFGCKVDNKCDDYWLWYSTINAPFFPVLTATGNINFPCKFSSTVDVPIIVPIIPVIEIGVEAGVEIAYCNDYSALDYVLGFLSVSVGITGMDFVPPPFDQLFSYQVASVGVGVTFYVSEAWCSVDNGVATYSSSEAYGLFRHIAKTHKGPQICRCLERGQTYPGLMYIIGGPDIPGILLITIPIFTPLAPFLLFTRITSSAMLENFPSTCELSLSRTGMSVEILLNLGFYSYTVNVISFEMSMTTKSGGADFIGAFMNKPKGLDAFIDQDTFSDRYLSGAFNRAGNKLVALINKQAAVWLAVVMLGGEVALAASKYFAAAVDGGKMLESVAGPYLKDLRKIFQPPRVIVYGCFDPHITAPHCTRKRKIFRHRFCVQYSMPSITCGATSKCIKYC